MNYVLVSQVLQGLKNLNSKPSYQTESHTLEVVVLDEIVKIDGEQLERDHQMLPEYHVVLDSYDIEGIIRVVLSQVHQDL